MNRRTLLGRFVFGAAAVLGAGMVAPKAEVAGPDDDRETAVRRERLRREYGDHLRFSQPGPLQMPGSLMPTGNAGPIGWGVESTVLTSEMWNTFRT